MHSRNFQLSRSSTSEDAATRQEAWPTADTAVPSDRELTLVSWRLDADHLEVAVAGRNLPKKLWARLGAQVVLLPKHGARELVRSDPGDVQEARYTNTFAAPLTTESFSLSDKSSDPAASYELRRGDHKGRMLLALPETLVCQQGDESISSPVQIAVDRLDRDLTLVSLELYPGFLEVAAAGAHLPTRVWARLGDRRVPLPKYGASQLARFDSGVEEARYASALAPPLTEAAFSLSSKTGSAATYELRRGDHKGRKLLALPESIVCHRGDRIVCSTPHARAGRLTGRAFDPADPGRTIFLELLETGPSDVAQAPSQISLATSVARGRFLDRDDSRTPSEAAFALALPAALLDGAAHELCLIARHGEHVDVLWRETFRASSGWVATQIRSCIGRLEARRLLVALAEAGRFEELAAYFANPRAYLDFPISTEDAFQVLAHSMLIGGSGEAYEYLHQRFQDFRELLFAGEVSQRTLLKIAASLLSSHSYDAKPHRFPHTPLTEALLDFVFVLEDTSDPGLLRDLVSFCTQTRRYVLARQLAKRWMRHDPKRATPRVMGASIELATGNIDAAETLVDEALALKPNSKDALLLLARIYAVRGKPLHAAAACSGGRGLSRWLESPPGYEEQRLIAPLDWPGLNAAVARRTQRAALLEHIGYAEDVHGAPERADEGGFSLVFLDRAERDVPSLFQELRGAGCMQVVNQHDVGMSEIESIGRWALIFCNVVDEYLTRDFVEAVFAQKRPYEPMVKLVSAKLNDSGKPEDFWLRGALVRTELLRAFGRCSLDAFVELAERAVRTKILLI